MTKRLPLLALAFSALLTPLSASAMLSQYPCDEVIFKGASVDYTREIIICKSNGDVSYTYGRINSQGGLDFRVPTSRVKWSSYSGTPWGPTLNQGKQVSVNNATITIDNGNFIYAVSIGNDRYNKYTDEINVYNRNGRRTANIKLDRKTVVSRVSKGLNGYGIKEEINTEPAHY